jgi:hypothetical protein
MKTVYALAIWAIAVLPASADLYSNGPPAISDNFLLISGGPGLSDPFVPRDLAANIRLREIPSLSGLRAFASLTVVLCHVVSP